MERNKIATIFLIIGVVLGFLSAFLYYLDPFFGAWWQWGFFPTAFTINIFGISSELGLVLRPITIYSAFVYFASLCLLSVAIVNKSKKVAVIGIFFSLFTIFIYIYSLFFGLTMPGSYLFASPEMIITGLGAGFYLAIASLIIAGIGGGLLEFIT